jgi:hypothetical protein
MRYFSCACLVAASMAVLSAGPAGAQPQPLWGTQTSASIADIRPGGGQSNSTVFMNGQTGQPISAVDIDDAVLPDIHGDGPWNRGRARAFAGLSFTTNAPPVLSAEARLTGNLSSRFEFGSFPDGATATSQAFASDIFRYNGSQPTTLGLTYTLDAEIGNAPEDGTLQTFAYAQIGVFNEAGYAFYPDLDTLIFEFGAHPLEHNGVDAVDTSMLLRTDTGGVPMTQSVTLLFDVTPGQVFYVFAKMGASAARGTRFADAYNTLSGSFSDPASVESLRVPSPASTIMLVVLGTSLTVRRRR